MRLYSFYQFSATASLILPSDRLGDLGFNTFIAIQSSAFLMTLFRKSLIPWYVHGIIYSSCLTLSVTHMIFVFPDILFWLRVVMAFMLRTRLGMNKYIIWALFVLSYYQGIYSLMPVLIEENATKLIEIANGEILREKILNFLSF